ncbi:MAG: PilZ domain-containing protein [Gammaproteobacteria bacterium]|nr:PilZ domain-containing protein [Gammaproteobacteria bacterium]
MKTERRDTPRIAISLDALLSREAENYQRSVTRDISLDGAFIEAAGRQFVQKDRLELAIRLPSDGAAHYHRFRGQVVRVVNGGAGIAFDRVDTESYEALLDLVFSRQGRGLW